MTLPMLDYTVSETKHHTHYEVWFKGLFKVRLTSRIECDECIARHNSIRNEWIALREANASANTPKSIRDISRDTLKQVDALVAERDMLRARTKYVTFPLETPKIDALVAECQALRAERDMLRAALKRFVGLAQHNAWDELHAEQNRPSMLKQGLAALAKVQS